MLALAAPVAFKQVLGFLRSQQAPSMDGVLGYLFAWRKRTQAAVILNELDADEFRRACAPKAELIDGTLDDDPLVEACLAAVNRIAPLDLDTIEMYAAEESLEYLYPACCGFPGNWDEWDDMTRNLGNYSADMALYVFVTCIRMGDGAALFGASEHYGWDLYGEDMDSLPDPDWDRLYELLDAHQMSCFKHAIDACLYSTGNPYFDYNPYDESETYDLPTFDLEGVRFLAEQWTAAQPILTDLRAAMEQFKKEPALAQVLLSLYAESAGEPERKPQTLAEIWAGDIDERRPVDPFYGPLDGEEEDDDNDD